MHRIQAKCGANSTAKVRGKRSLDLLLFSDFVEKRNSGCQISENSFSFGSFITIVGLKVRVKLGAIVKLLCNF